jgi:hypothetical protein
MALHSSRSTAIRVRHPDHGGVFNHKTPAGLLMVAGFVLIVRDAVGNKLWAYVRMTFRW